MKNKVKEFFLIEGTIYPFDILFTIADYDKVIRYIERNKAYKLSDTEKDLLVMHGNGRTVQLRMGAVIVRVKKEKTKIGFELHNLSHELCHAVHFIFDRIGLTIDGVNDEAFCYYQAYLVKKILEEYDR